MFPSVLTGQPEPAEMLSRQLELLDRSDLPHGFVIEHGERCS